MITFYHNINIDMSRIACTLANLANICLHKSAAKIYSFTAIVREWDDQVGGGMGGALSMYQHKL